MYCCVWALLCLLCEKRPCRAVLTGLMRFMAPLISRIQPSLDREMESKTLFETHCAAGGLMGVSCCMACRGIGVRVPMVSCDKGKGFRLVLKRLLWICRAVEALLNALSVWCQCKVVLMAADCISCIQRFGNNRSRTPVMNIRASSSSQATSSDASRCSQESHSLTNPEWSRASLEQKVERNRCCGDRSAQ